MPQRNRMVRIVLASVIAAALFQLGQTHPAGFDAEAYAASAVVTLYGSAPDAPDSELQSIVEGVVSGLPGTWGVAVKKLDTGQYAVYNGDVQQVSASLYKMWVLCELFRQARAGVVSLDDYASVSGDDAYEDSAAGELR